MRHSNLRQLTLAIVGVVSLVGAASCESDNTADDTNVVSSDVALRDDMRRLWTEHVLFTRVYLIANLDDLPDLDVATERLLQNQVDIGNAMRPFYGDVAANELTRLLTEHITGAAAVVAAAKAGNATALADASTAWYVNAHEIALFLSNASPYLPLDDVDAMMRTHLDQTIVETTARLQGNHTLDVQVYDAIVVHIQHMADAISAAVIEQFPNRIYIDPTVTVSAGGFHRGMRSLWHDHAAWTRVFLIESVANLPSIEGSQQRLLDNQDDIGRAVRSFYGEEAGAVLTTLLREHITLAARIVTDARIGNFVDLQIATDLWYANADQIATFLASANPNWSFETLQTLMRMHLDQTLVEANARLHGDWAADVEAYDTVQAHMLHMADVLSGGIVTQFPDRFVN